MGRSSEMLNLAMLAWLATPASAADEFDAGTLERAAQQELGETGTPGAAVAVVSGDQLVFAKGFGVASAETGVAVTPETLFQVGSVTKTFTAAAALSMVEDGRLSLESPVGAWVQGLAPPIARLTLHQLLSQTSGLRDEGASYGSHDEAALGEAIRHWSDDRVLLEPGKAFSYSNPGLALAGLVLEARAGRPYADEMVERLLKPLGMQRSTFRPTLAMTYPLASGHSGARDHPTIVRPMGDDTRYWPAGYLYTSAAEMARFLVALLNQGRLEGRQVLPATLLDRMTTRAASFPHVLDGDGYGYGVFLDDSRGVRVVGHGGQMPGFSAVWRAVPARRLAVIVLGNREGQGYAKTVEAALAGALPPLPRPSPASPRAMTPEEMDRYAGVYSNRWPMEVLVKEGRLFLKWGGKENPVTKIGDGRFLAVPERGDPVEFLLPPGADGKPEYLQVFVWAYRRQAQPPRPAN